MWNCFTQGGPKYNSNLKLKPEYTKIKDSGFFKNKNKLYYFITLSI